MLGAIVGIPIALAISRWQQNEQDRMMYERLAKEQLQRKQFVLGAIRDELRTNRDILEQMIEEQDTKPGTYPIVGMKDVNWKALSDSGELKSITDASILIQLSEAYYYINALILLEGQYSNPYFQTSVEVESAGGRHASYAGAKTVARVNRIRPEALTYVINAIKVIDEDIGGDLQFSDGTIGSLPRTFDQ